MKNRFAVPPPDRLEKEVFASIEFFRIFLFISEFLFIVLPLTTVRLLKAVFCSIFQLR